MAIANVSPTQQRHSHLPVASSLGNSTPGIDNTIRTWRLGWLICLLGGSDHSGNVRSDCGSDMGSDRDSDMGSDVASYQLPVS